MLLTDILALNTCVNSHCFSRMNQHSKLILDSCRTCLKQYKCLNITLNCIHKNTFRMSRWLQITVWQKKIKMIHECKFLPKGLRFDTKTVLSSNLHFFRACFKTVSFYFQTKAAAVWTPFYSKIGCSKRSSFRESIQVQSL